MLRYVAIIYGYFMSIVSTKQLFIPLLAFQLIMYQVVMSIYNIYKCSKHMAIS